MFMTNDKIIKSITDHGFPKGFGLRKYLSENPTIKKSILNNTAFLDDAGVKNIDLALRTHCITNGITEIPKCPNCGSKILRKKAKACDPNGYTMFSEFCSAKCAAASGVLKERMVETNLEKYGVEFVSQTDAFIQKRNATNAERFDGGHPMRSEHHKEKFKTTMLEKYGVEYAQQSEAIKEKTKKSNFEKFGFDNPMKNKETAEKVSTALRQRNLEKGFKMGVFGFSSSAVDILSDKEKLSELYKEVPSTTAIATIIGVSAETVRRRINEHGIEISHTSSVMETELYEYIRSIYKGTIIRNSRKIIDGYEIDIFLPEEKIGFEFNGVYWHSSVHKEKSYHQKKSLKCAENGILLIHVWEDDWVLKKEVVKNKIKSKLSKQEERVYARKTVVKEVERYEIEHILENYHIQGKTTASKWYALMYDGQPVATIGIKNIGDGVWDLVRFASSVSVVGGFSKLLSHFKKSNDWSEIITFAHMDYSVGGMYEKSGFERHSITQPALWYVRRGVRHRREKFMKHKLPDIMGDLFDETMTEWENMLKIGYVRLFDAGSIKYVMKKENPLK